MNDKKIRQNTCESVLGNAKHIFNLTNGGPLLLSLDVPYYGLNYIS